MFLMSQNYKNSNIQCRDVIYSIMINLVVCHLFSEKVTVTALKCFFSLLLVVSVEGMTKMEMKTFDI